MKFVIDKNELLSLVIPAHSAASSKATLPALEGILLSVRGDELTISGYDLEKGVRAVGTVRNSEDGEVIINAQKIAAIVRNMPDDDVVFESDDKSNATITGGNAEFNIHGMSASAFPSMPMLDNESAFAIPRKVLKELIVSTLFSVAQTESRPILTGECFMIDGADITVVALDGVRMAVRKAFGVIANNIESYKAVIPGKALAELVKLLGDSEEPVNIGLTRKNIIFKFDSIVLFTRLLEGDYVDYEGLVPKEPKIFVEVEAVPFLDCLERVSLMVDDKLKPPVRCMIGDDSIEISCSNQFGKAVDCIPVKKKGEDLEIGLDNRFLMDVLRTCKDDSLNIEMTTAFMGIVIKPTQPEKDREYIYVIAPRRLR